MNIEIYQKQKKRTLNSVYINHDSQNNLNKLNTLNININED